MREKVLEILKKYNQEHLLRFENELTEEQKESLYKQILDIDFSLLDNLNQKEEIKNSDRNIVAMDCLEIDQINEKRDIYKATGLKAIKEGKLAAVLLAGGQGTRLGFDHSKGMFNVGINKTLYIFEQLINNLREVTDEADAYVPFYIMCSDKNYDEIKTFFKEHNNFGYPEEYLAFFKQEMAPSSDRSGKIYLEAKDRISLSPNGNGGWFSSLYKAGLVDDAKRRGVEWLNIFAIDNVLQRIADPVFTGAIIEEGKVAGGKVVRKADENERVGNLCLEDGRPQIVEYYEMTPELLAMKKENGDPLFNFGVILNYTFRLDKLIDIMNDKIPVHVVEKKIPYIDEEGNMIKPESPNGYKFETLVLDMIHLLENCLPYEVVREKEFAPIKNPTGVDSVESARELLIKNGIEI